MPAFIMGNPHTPNSPQWYSHYHQKQWDTALHKEFLEGEGEDMQMIEGGGQSATSSSVNILDKSVITQIDVNISSSKKRKKMDPNSFPSSSKLDPNSFPSSPKSKSGKSVSCSDSSDSSDGEVDFNSFEHEGEEYHRDENDNLYTWPNGDFWGYIINDVVVKDGDTIPDTSKRRRSVAAPTPTKDRRKGMATSAQPERPRAESVQDTQVMSAMDEVEWNMRNRADSEDVLRAKGLLGKECQFTFNLVVAAHHQAALFALECMFD